MVGLRVVGTVVGRTDLARKLGITRGARVLVAHAPKSFTLVRSNGRAPFDVAVVFVMEAAHVAKRFLAVTPRMTQAGGVWLAWPKKASKIETDVSDNVLRRVVLPTGWVDNKVCAIDSDYSGLRFVLRRENRKN